MFRHLFPRLHWSAYERDGERRLVLWRQWFGRVWDVLDIRIPGKAA
jgi:hypothetical protein